MSWSQTGLARRYGLDVVEYSMLGPLEVVCRGEEVPVTGRNERIVLAALAGWAGDVVSNDRLTDALWGDAPPRSSTKIVQNLIMGLRKILGDTAIETRPGGYVLRLEPDESDIRRFDALVVSGRAATLAGEWNASATALAEATGLWRGSPLVELRDWEPGLWEAVRLEELYRCIVEELAEAELACGRHRDRLAVLYKIVSEEPLRERRWALLMLALYRCGQQAEALRAFQRAATALGELGLTPGSELVMLERAIGAGDLSLGPPLARLTSVGERGSNPARDPPSGRARRTRAGAGPSVGNLPVQLTSFVGRDAELVRVADALAVSRVVTLTGVGGVGKTRLALQAAGEASSLFPHGAWLCELAPVRDPDRVGAAVAAALGVTARPGSTPEESLLAFLRDQLLLVVLDNCEHLLRPVARLVVIIEATCPGVRVLATSREGLNIGGEQLLIVPALLLPGVGAGVEATGDCEAVRLFTERARAVKADFAVDAANRVEIVAICARLDGLALAIELAAARIHAINPTELLRRLDRRFRLLHGGDRVAVERHQTLRATIDWSYDLLTEPQQRLLARLVVFAGGCTLVAAEAVCAGDPIDGDDVFDLLAGLVARSLVVADDTGRDTRYRLLETIREYAEERLNTAERTELCIRHTGFFASLVEAVARGTRGPEQLRWLQQAEPEIDNVRTAMEWTLANDDAVTAERFVSAADDTARGFAVELLRHTEAVLGLPSITAIERYPFALMAGASAAVGRGDTARAEHLCAQALEVTSEPNDELEGRAAVVRFQAAMVTGDRYRLIEHLERALHHFRRLGSPYRLVHVLNLLAAIRTHGGDRAAATDAAREALVFARQTGNPGLTSGSLAGLAFVLADSEPERSRELIAESLELNHHLAATVVDELALVLTIVASAMLGERNQVMRLSARAFDCGLTGITPLSSCLECAAEALATGEPAVAAVVHGYLDACAPHLTERQPHLTFRQRATAVIDAQLDVKHVIELHAQGAAMTLNQATAHALEAIERVMPDATH